MDWFPFLELQTSTQLWGRPFNLAAPIGNVLVEKEWFLILLQ